MRNTKTNITIVNTAPINGGDEALLFGTILGLKDTFESPTINVLCNNPILTRKVIPNISFHWDWEYVFMKNVGGGNPKLFSFKQRIRKYLKRSFKSSYYTKLSQIFATSEERKVFNILKKTDLVIVGAGGYIHDFYGYDDRLKTLRFIHDELKVPYVVFGQSVGPFWKESNYKNLIEVFNNAKSIFLREDISLKHLKKIGHHCNNVYVSNDVAFYLVPKYAKNVKRDKLVKNIVLNFREWSYQESSKQNLEKAITLCEFLISSGYSLTFLSTCQGLEDYVDDSDFARNIVNSLKNEFSNSCTIVDEKMSLAEFVDFLSNQDAYIGMRLHGAILSLIAGIPALNIGYEDKTIGVFNKLDISKYAFSYEEDADQWVYRAGEFLNDHQYYLDRIDSIRNNAYQSVIKNFELLK